MAEDMLLVSSPETNTGNYIERLASVELFILIWLFTNSEIACSEHARAHLQSLKHQYRHFLFKNKLLIYLSKEEFTKHYCNT